MQVPASVHHGRVRSSSLTRLSGLRLLIRFGQPRLCRGSWGGESGAKRRDQARVAGKAVESLARCGPEHRAEPELPRLAQPPVGMGDVAQLPRQPDLTEAANKAVRLLRFATGG